MSTEDPPLPKSANDQLEEQPPELPRFRYSLQSLFIGTGGLCLVLGGMVAAGPMGGFVLLMGVLVVGAHVLGAVLGKSLRYATSERLAQKPAERLAVEIPISTEAAWIHQPFEQSLVGIVSGALLGGLGGGSVLTWLNWQNATIANVSFGAIAFATLGGIGGFAVNSFWRAMRTSWESSLAASETKTGSRQLSPPLDLAPAESFDQGVANSGENSPTLVGSKEKLLDSLAD